MPLAYLIREAVDDFARNGYDSETRLATWMERIRAAAEAELISETQLQNELRTTLTAIYQRLIERGDILRQNPGVDRYTVARIRPQLREELNRRIVASANLIKLNREEAIQATLRRFSGWATSVPSGGIGTRAGRREAAEQTRKELTKLGFQTRRVAIDQGHKFASSLAQIVANDGGAIAAIWHQHYTRYPRIEHKKRDGRVYLIRNSWAHKAGLVKPGPAGYTDQITQPGEEVYCFPGDTLIPFANGIEVAYRRWYSGELAEIVTSSGKTFRTTPNHPILTTNGWVAAGYINQGDNIVQIADQVIGSTKSELDYDMRVPAISQIFSTLNGLAIKSRGQRKQFHGDGTDSDIDIVFAARPLSIGLDSLPIEGCNQFGLSIADYSVPFDGVFDKFLFGGFNAASRLMSSGHKLFSLLWQKFGPALQHLIGADVPRGCVGIGGQSSALFGDRSDIPLFSSVGSTAYLYAKFAQNCIDPVYRNTGASGYFSSAQSSDVPLRNLLVTGTRRVSFLGHVYNLQTRTGWYAADGIIAHNCRCDYEYLYGFRKMPPEMITEKGRAELERIRNAA